MGRGQLSPGVDLQHGQVGLLVEAHHLGLVGLLLVVGQSNLDLIGNLAAQANDVIVRQDVALRVHNDPGAQAVLPEALLGAEFEEALEEILKRLGDLRRPAAALAGDNRLGADVHHRGLHLLRYFGECGRELSWGRQGQRLGGRSRVVRVGPHAPGNHRSQQDPDCQRGHNRHRAGPLRLALDLHDFLLPLWQPQIIHLRALHGHRRSTPFFRLAYPPGG